VVSAIRHNFGLKVLSLVLAIVGWAYFRFATNPLITARFDQQLSVPIAAVNLAPGYIARYPDKNAVITITPKRGEAPIKPEEIKAVLDLANHTAGVYNVPVQLVAPNISVQSRSPASETLTIERIAQQSYPIAVNYSGQPATVVSKVAVQPQSVMIHGPSGELSEIAAVRVDLPLGGTQLNFDQMIRPIAVNAHGDEIADVQIVPNLIRVRAQLLPAAGTRK
jgi:YbbR domain-containing protein